MSSDFRHVLRTSTRLEHEELDRLFFDLDLAERRGFILFAQVHLASFSQMIGQTRAGQWAHAQLADMIACLRSDLHTLGEEPLNFESAAAVPCNDLAMDYIIGGSRMGTIVLRKRWMLSADPLVNQANAYFGLPAEPGQWRATCADLSALDPESDVAAQVTADTKSIYLVFKNMFEMALPPSTAKRSF